MISISVENIYSYIEDFSSIKPHILQELHLKTSYLDANYQFAKAFQTGRWDGRRYFLTGKGRFPTGLLRIVLDCLKGKERISISDLRKLPEKEIQKDWEWIGFELRDYQEEVVNKALVATRGIFEIPTRGGKTSIAGKIIFSLKMPVLYIVVGKESMYQTAKDLKEYISDITIGLYGDGHKDQEGDIIIALIPSLHRTKDEKLLKRPLLLIDEIHQAGAKTYYDTLMKSRAYYRYGFSGTVLREDNADLKMYALTGKMFYNKESKEMWDAGYIMKPVVRWIKIKEPKIHRSMHYLLAYEAGIVRCLERNSIIVSLLKKHSEDQVLISVEKIEHGEILSSMIRDSGIANECPFVHSNAENRNYDILRFVSGELKAIISTRILNQSLTMPYLSVLINAAGRQSEIEVVQRIGRSIGKVEGKNTVIIYDFIDEHCNYLFKHSMERFKILKKRGFEQEGMII